MLFERVFSEGLALNSYIIGDGGVAAVIDPRRDVRIYPEIAAQHACTITHIFETHRNEDYVVGSSGLAELCGADIFHGAATDFTYGNPVREGDMFAFGSLSLGVLETPGHTEESISLVLRDEESGDEPWAVFCGDTLLAGDIARTDFFGTARNGEMAATIYDSIVQKILPLGDGVIVCPAHGAGSVCAGSSISDRPFTTCGYEKAANPFLRMGKKRFVSLRKQGSHPLPPYFRMMERWNLAGAPVRPLSDPAPLSAAGLDGLRAGPCQILDIRGPSGFAGGHVPGSISIWKNGISSFAGWFLSYDDPIAIVDDFDGDAGPVILQLYRMGFDNIAGVLAGGIGTWYKHAGTIAKSGTCSVQELHERLGASQDRDRKRAGGSPAGTPYILDVRDADHRHAFGHIRNSHHIFVGELPGRVGEVPADRTIYVICDAGFKAGIAASILLRNGFPSITNVLGGMTAWLQAGFGVEH